MQTPRRPIPPKKKASTQYLTKPLDETTEGQLFRVRDKDWERVWDENLSYADACKLKEKVVTSGKSRTARVENMNVAPPDWYTAQLAEIEAEADLEGVAAGNDNLPELQAPALAAAKREADAANARRENARVQAQAAAKDRSAAVKPAAVRPLVAAPPPPKPKPRPEPLKPRPVPVVSTVLAEDEEDEPVTPVKPGEVGDLVRGSGSDKVTAEDAKRMRERQGQAPPVKIPPATPELQKKAKELYEAERARKGGGAPFEKLHPQVQGHWRLEASRPPKPPPPVGDQTKGIKGRMPEPTDPEEAAAAEAAALAAREQANAEVTAEEMAPNVADMVESDSELPGLIEQAASLPGGTTDDQPTQIAERETQTITAEDVGDAGDLLGPTS